MSFFSPKKRNEKIFQSKLLEYIQKLVDISWGYIDNNEEDINTIYVICSSESNCHTYDTFYHMGGSILENHETPNESFDKASMMQDSGLVILNEIINHFKVNKKDVPTLIKIEYSFITKEIKYDFEYDLLWSNKNNGALPSDSYDLWLKKVKDNLNE